MAKKDSFVNMVVTLFVITAIPAVLLGFVYKFTKEPIEQAKKIKLSNSIDLVVPGASTAEINQFSVMPETGKDSLTFYEVVSENKIIGTAVQTYSDNAFGGRITIMVGFKPDGTIIDNDVLEHSETPGLGDKASKSKSDWNSQFKDKNPKEFNINLKKDGGEVDAITAATISSRAYIDALQRAYDAFIKYYTNSSDIEESLTIEEIDEQIEQKTELETNDTEKGGVE
ncbi:MAG TPA: RnfABCDGE type electron transport complex subunit G [Bacteroidales bacterium]|nr:RnfABCDGE type electron transport complex subunit G [Bacteroidales bacterium]